MATRELLPYLARGRQVITPETGHVDELWRLHSQALDRLLKRLFDGGVADVRFDAPPPDTVVRVGLPEIAHGFEGLTALALCAGIAALARRDAGTPDAPAEVTQPEWVETSELAPLWTPGEGGLEQHPSPSGGGMGDRLQLRIGQAPDLRVGQLAFRPDVECDAPASQIVE